VPKRVHLPLFIEWWNYLVEYHALPNQLDWAYPIVVSLHGRECFRKARYGELRNELV